MYRRDQYQSQDFNDNIDCEKILTVNSIASINIFLFPQA